MKNGGPVHDDAQPARRVADRLVSGRCDNKRDVRLHLYFFFQAEDGIRDLTVTGVQTCALPIFLDQNIVSAAAVPIVRDLDPVHGLTRLPWLISAYALAATAALPLYGKLCDVYGRSEERRVGKECRSRWSPYH